ncbi:unnamed protein product [Chondrus crispus]|uniref:Uncharacterized protein n=1 Tax=Chondrus crispus TaxID=2769 RepID=R7QRN4_CHOCR|nr:unnamed protein product [Chondrus crispus]CDF41157.1 unnamed protein product [Chondrus crispus]|eukprot:XP_005711451.1 unnamed protein product [Chondrus crispus]
MAHFGRELGLLADGLRWFEEGILRFTQPEGGVDPVGVMNVCEDICSSEQAARQ